MNYHGRMMNLQERYPDYMRESEDIRRHHYRVGHRDARHAAAEIVAEADAVIAELLEAMQDAMRWFAKLEDWRGVGDPDIDKYRAAIEKATGEKP